VLFRSLINYPGGMAGAYTIPNSVTSLGNEAFVNCTGLVSVSIGNRLVSLGAGAFAYCTNLRSAYFHGNAASFNSQYPPFRGANNVTVYYLPGTTGWGPTYAGRPTALWANPVVLEGSIQIEGNALGFTIAWAPNATVEVEASPTLIDPTWSAVSTNILVGGVSQFTDPEAATHPARFYRLRSP
jgi:hypothetical protein